MLKRLFDLICSGIGLVFLSPFFLIMALWIKTDTKGPVFYRGLRVGLRGKLFRIFKFRSMIINAEKIGPSSTKEDDHRITSVGKCLRKNKIDELPQLLNVFIGDMSLVGPRPQVKWAVDLYSEEEKQILNVKPGITDFASIEFNNEGEILAGSDDPDKMYMEIIHPQKIRLSLEYVENNSIFIDMKIIYLTLKSLL